MITGRCTRTADAGAAWYIVFSEAAGEGSALRPYRFLGDFWRFLEAGSVEALEVVRSGAEVATESGRFNHIIGVFCD